VEILVISISSDSGLILSFMSKQQKMKFRLRPLFLGKRQWQKPGQNKAETK